MQWVIDDSPVRIHLATAPRPREGNDQTDKATNTPESTRTGRKDREVAYHTDNFAEKELRLLGGDNDKEQGSESIRVHRASLVKCLEDGS